MDPAFGDSIVLKNIDNANELAGKFGRLFKGLSPATFSESDLFKLGDAMTSTDGPKDGPDGEESDFGSAYIYFGRFVVRRSFQSYSQGVFQLSEC